MEAHSHLMDGSRGWSLLLITISPDELLRTDGVARP
jgi:hypothetical protein